MKGLDLARQYYLAYGKEMLETQFPQVLPYLAVGLEGSGSECYGYDDLTSRDHDFEPGFCIFLPDEETVDRRTEFLLERAYAKLPKTFMGLERSPIGPVGGNRHGVIRIEEFFLAKTGTSDGVLSPQDWFSLPEHGLLEATNGAVFSDPSGHFTKIREKLRYFPEDIRLKKLAGHLLLMGQAGQYNYPRCLSRGERGAAQLAVYEFVQSALHAIYLLNRAYMPYYKWCFRGLRELPLLHHLEPELEYLISSGNTADLTTEKNKKIEEICTALADQMRKQGLTEQTGNEMEQIAYRINDRISDSNLRNLHVLYGV